MLKGIVPFCQLNAIFYPNMNFTDLELHDIILWPYIKIRFHRLPQKWVSEYWICFTTCAYHAKITNLQMNASKWQTLVPASPASLERDKTTVSTGYQFGGCVISQLGKSFTYDCEYFGSTERLIITPLTERAVLSLTMSLGSFQCGTMIGPPGTGKTDTIRDLAVVSAVPFLILRFYIFQRYINKPFKIALSLF